MPQPATIRNFDLRPKGSWRLEETKNGLYYEAQAILEATVGGGASVRQVAAIRLTEEDIDNLLEVPKIRDLILSRFLTQLEAMLDHDWFSAKLDEFFSKRHTAEQVMRHLERMGHLPWFRKKLAAVLKDEGLRQLVKESLEEHGDG